VNSAYITTTTEAIDPVFMFIFGACLVLLVGITTAMVFFVVRYHRSRAPEPTSQATGNLWLEVVWIVLPTLLVLAMFYYGWAGYLALRNVPKGAMEVTATARMWSWSFAYPNGRTSAKLYVPVNKPVRVELVSQDVIHGFYLPAFRVKRDVVPGMKNYAWFVATKSGSYDLFCSQYCGTGHSAMITTVEALPAAEFAAWLEQRTGKGELPGHELLEKYGCLGCHSLDGKPGIGPTFKGLFGAKVTVLKGKTKTTVTADEGYLRESIRQPAAAVVEGFQAIMPTDPDLSDDDVTALVKFIEGLR
jgi:cytochrome c oxidase subunit 2